jgi:hypothetical protein
MATNKHASTPPSVGAGRKKSGPALPAVKSLQQMHREEHQPAKVKPQGVLLPGGHVGFKVPALKKP